STGTLDLVRRHRSEDPHRLWTISERCDRARSPEHSAIDVRSAGDGVGTINFAPMPLGWMMQASWAPWLGASAVPAFRAIPDASRVHGIIQDAREQTW